MQLNDYRLWTALVTPMNEDYTVNYPDLENLIKAQVNANNGLLILGSTGEALNLSATTKREIINFVCDLNLNVPIMAGVGGHDLPETKSWVEFLEARKIHSYLMVTPLYAKPGDEGQYQWFKSLMDTATRPVMLYNVPGRTGKELSLTAVERLASHPNFWAIKEASGSVEKFLEYKAAAKGAPVYCGDDGLFPSFAGQGSHGLVSVASNVWPSATHAYVDKCLAKTFDAKELWENAANSLFIASNPIPAKRALFEKGEISSATCAPPLAAADLADWSIVKENDQKITNWLQEQIEK